MFELRKKLKTDEILIGTQIFTNSTDIAELCGSMGYDFIFICAEHTASSIETVRNLVKSVEGSGTPALVRLPELDKTFTKKVLDLGTNAVLFSMIKNKTDATNALDMCLYPPYGKRGFGPMAAVRWGLDSEKSFVENNNDGGTVRLLQIEHIGMIEDLDEIAANPYVDGYIFGPNDLAASMGHIMDMYHPDAQSAIKHAVKILDKHNARYGVSLGSATTEQMEYWKSLGMTIFSIGSDFSFVRDGALNALREMKKLK